MKWRPLILTGIILLLLSGFTATAQIFDKVEQVKIDTNYVEAYKDELTVRAYLSRKQNGYTLSSRLFSPWLRYKTNDNLLIGAGYTYNFLTLNLAVKLPFINGDDGVYGKSKYVDLQAHTIFRSYIIDLYLQWNSGHYVANADNVIPNWTTDDGYPIRGDLRTNIIGLNLQYLFNSSKFSYKASFLQNEFQKRSAGSPIAGIEAYWVLGTSDSLMVGGNIPPSGFYKDQPFNQIDVANIGLNGGYAYTFVWNEKLFLSLSTVFGLSGGYNRVHYTETSLTSNSGITAGFTNSTRISLGFNSRQYYFGLSFIHFSMTNLSPGYGDWFGYSTGNIRVNFVRRFKLKKSILILRPDLWIMNR